MDAITYSSSVFQESSLNDGTISNTLIITCNNVSGETFTGINGEDFLLSGKAAVSNIPAGLSTRIVKKDNLTLVVVLTGAATSHDNANDITNLKIVFNNSAFSLNSAACVANAYRTNLAVNFIQIYNVGSTGDHTTIAGALGVCDDGDILNLAAQTFTEFGLDVTKNISIRGQGAKSTFIQAADRPNVASDRILTTNSFTRVRITGVTIQFGKSDIVGGIFACGDSLTLQNVNISHNIGGGIHLYSGHLSVFNSQISLNTSNSSGAGGLFVDQSCTAAIVNCTFNHNAGTMGAGIQCFEGNIDIKSSTIACNHGTGITVIMGKITVSNSILDSNYSWDYDIKYSVELNDNGFNIVMKQNATNASGNWRFTQVSDFLFNYTASGTTSAQWNKNNTTLANQTRPIVTTPNDNSTLNGTQTLALTSGSFAINAGTATGAPATDQRGYLRNGTTDIGAFEFGGTTALMPTVTTASISTFSSTTATLGGNVSSDGGNSVTEYGIVYNLTGTPSVLDTKVPIGNGTGTFSASVSGLLYGTTYYVRGYAINSLGISYGSTVSFTTSLVSPTITTTPATTVAYGHRYNYKVGATTVGGEATTLTAPTLPGWLTFSSAVSATAQSFGGIPSGTLITGTAGDDDGNTYAIKSNGTTIFKIAADGTTTTWKSGLRNGIVNSLLLANGYLYIPRNSNNYSITRVSLTNPLAAEETFDS